MYVRDTLDGEKMQEEINDLKMLLLAYKKGLIKEKKIVNIIQYKNAPN